MTAAIDLDAYFERIGYAGARTPTLDTLAAIHLRHVQAIPFENLNPLLRLPVRLDPQSLQQKLVREGRGGYCFEQNLLLSHALRGIGFDVTWLAARVLWNNPEGTVTARSHMLLLVKLDEGPSTSLRASPYIADVGFGGLTLTGPLRLQADEEQTTPHEPFRLTRSGDDDYYFVQARCGGVWRTLYRFTLHEQLLPDYEVSNWYLSNHPESHFVTGLIAARADANRRYALRGNELAIHHLDGTTERRVLASAEEIEEALKTLFRVRLPDVPNLRAALARIAAAAGAAPEAHAGR